MKPEELRIGNYVSNQTGELENIQVGKPHKITLYDFTVLIKFYVPIKLTKEWLLKFGFRKEKYPRNWGDDVYVIYDLKNFKIGIKDNYIAWYNQCEDDYYSSYYPELKYVHQLQNLYFILTGKELKLK